MKKLLVIFLSIFTMWATPALCASSCESSARSQAFRNWGFDFDTKIPQEYKEEIERIKNSTVSDAHSGQCIPEGAYNCQIGDKLSDCCPCADFIAQRQVEEKYIQDYIEENCPKEYSGTILDQSGTPIRGAEIYIKGNNLPDSLSDLNGNFSISEKGINQSTQITITANGYQELTRQIGPDDVLTITLTPAQQRSETSQQETSQQETRQHGTETITLSITVLDSQTNDPLPGANIYAVDKDGKKINRNAGVLGDTTDLDGNATIPDFPANEQIEVSYIGYKTQRLSPGRNRLTVLLVEDANTLNEITITAPGVINKPCDVEAIQYANATSGTIQRDNTTNSLYCDIQCPKGRNPSKLNAEIAYFFDQATTYYLTQECKCNTGTIEINGECKSTNNCATDKNANTSNYVSTQNGVYKCEIVDCSDGWKPADDKQSCVKKLTECTTKQKEQHPNASATGIKPGTETCIATACKCGFDLNNDKCVEWEKDTTTNEYRKPCPTDTNTEPKLPKNAKSGTLQCDNGAAYCKISDCNDGFRRNPEKNTCESLNKQPCTSTDKNATSAEYRRVNGKTVCFITACSSKFNPSDDGTKCIGKNILSEADSLEKINKLQKNADEMRKIEQSTANKALGAAGIGATSIGGQMLASALSEQSADADAESAMRAYLATFHCNYGAGKNIPGGEKDIELPGGNELISLYSEYVNLANNLKVRKNALGLRPGIESEPILDSATSGLYDDVSIGKTSGAYASLARALMDPNSADAAAWAAQKSDTSDKLKTGAITAGIGAIGSLAGNLIINRNNPDENSRQIIAEYDLKRKIFQDLEIEITALPPAPVPATTKCPNDANGTYPNCTCKNTKQIYVEKANGCENCPGDKINIAGKCDCQSPLIPGENDTCITATPSAQCSGDNIALDEVAQQCVCINGYIKTDNGTSCHCPNATHHIENDQCVKNATIVATPVTPAPETITINLPADTLFAHSKADLTDAAKNALNKFISDLNANKFSNCKIEIRGYTDGTGSDTFNQKLSQQRADAVKNHLTSQNNSPISNTSTATGMGEGHCSCAAGIIPSDKTNDTEYKQCVGKNPNYTNNNNLRFAPCRKVTITVNANECKSSSNATINLLNQSAILNPTTIKKN